MTQTLRASTLALALSAGWITPAHAAAPAGSEVQQQLAAMAAELARLGQRVDTLEGQVEAANARAEAAEQRTVAVLAQAEAAKAAAPAPSATAKPATEVTWDGAPKLATKDGWSFKPRGRLQVDSAGIDAPAGIPGQASLGIATEFRRAYLGVEGTIPGGFGYRAEIDVANSAVELTDLYLTYRAKPELTLTLGQHKPFWGLEEMTSDLFTSFMERAAYHGAFGFERRVGVSAAYAGKSLVVQGGIFADNAADLNADTNNSYSIDGRVVFMPRLAGGQLHLGGSVHLRDFNDAQATTRYRARPFVHTTDLRLVNTGNIPATGEISYGAELAYVAGRFHATAESHWISPRRPGMADPTFNGGYGEVGLLLTDDAAAYKNGVYDRVRPKKPLGKGGIGAIQANLRYDWLDLSDAGIVGGKQDVAAVSLQWMPSDYVRFILNYGHLWLTDAALAAGATRDYEADSIGLRAQFDF